MTTLGLWGPCAAALALSPPPTLSRAPAEPTLCLVGGADVAGRYQLQAPQVGLWRGFVLPRSHLELGADFGGIGRATFELAAVRSGGATGYIGVAGESLVPRVQVVAAQVFWPLTGLAASAGLLEDPWIRSADQAWTYRPVAAPFAMESGWFDRSDLGASVAWTAPRDLGSVEVFLHTGEGLARRERNLGFDTTAMLTVRPLAAVGEPGRLGIAVVAREGSRGLGSARDHRGAIRVSGRPGPVDLGVEALMAFGVEGDAERTPKALSAWAGIRDLGPVRGFFRVDLAAESLADPAGSGSLHVLGGGGVALPPRGALAPVDVLIGYEGLRWGPDIRTAAGAESQAQQHRVWIQLGLRLRGAVRMVDLPPPVVPATLER